MNSDLLANSFGDFAISTMNFDENMDPKVPPKSPEKKRKCDDTPTYKNARAKTGAPHTWRAPYLAHPKNEKKKEKATPVCCDAPAF